MDRRANHRLAQPVPPFGKGLGMSKPKRPRISALGVNPNDDQKTLSKQQMIPDRL
jgi:hypothetical protein